VADFQNSKRRIKERQKDFRAVFRGEKEEKLDDVRTFQDNFTSQAQTETYSCWSRHRILHLVTDT